LKKIIFTVIEANKPTPEAIKRLNKAVHEVIFKTKEEQKKSKNQLKRINLHILEVFIFLILDILNSKYIF